MYVMYLQSSTWRTPNRYFCATRVDPRGSLSTHWIGMENGLGRWSDPEDGHPYPGPQPVEVFSVRWWLNQPLLENISQNGFIFPKFHFRGEISKKYLSCHLPPVLSLSPYCLEFPELWHLSVILFCTHTMNYGVWKNKTNYCNSGKWRFRKDPKQILKNEFCRWFIWLFGIVRIIRNPLSRLS